MRAPVSRPRPLSLRGRSCLLVGDRPFVGDLGLAREFEFGLAHHLVGGPDPGGARGVLRRARGDFQAAEFLAGQRRLLVGVVL